MSGAHIIANIVAAACSRLIQPKQQDHNVNGIKSNEQKREKTINSSSSSSSSTSVPDVNLVKLYQQIVQLGLHADLDLSDDFLTRPSSPSSPSVSTSSPSSIPFPSSSSSSSTPFPRHLNEFDLISLSLGILINAAENSGEVRLSLSLLIQVQQLLHVRNQKGERADERGETAPRLVLFSEVLCNEFIHSYRKMQHLAIIREQIQPNPIPSNNPDPGPDPDPDPDVASDSIFDSTFSSVCSASSAPASCPSSTSSQSDGDDDGLDAKDQSKSEKIDDEQKSKTMVDCKLESQFESTKVAAVCLSPVLSLLLDRIDSTYLSHRVVCSYSALLLGLLANHSDSNYEKLQKLLWNQQQQHQPHQQQQPQQPQPNPSVEFPSASSSPGSFLTLTHVLNMIHKFIEFQIETEVLTDEAFHIANQIVKSLHQRIRQSNKLNAIANTNASRDGMLS